MCRKKNKNDYLQAISIQLLIEKFLLVVISHKINEKMNSIGVPLDVDEMYMKFGNFAVNSFNLF